MITKCEFWKLFFSYFVIPVTIDNKLKYQVFKTDIFTSPIKLFVFFLQRLKNVLIFLQLASTLEIVTNLFVLDLSNLLSDFFN